ncbi:MAG: DUF58 domain-containing protein, partial [Methanoregula sp.]|nr:DUF58 domain-containing protein [Methanoregula sp.]
MRPTRFTRALLVAAGFLVLAALLLDDPALLLGSILLLVVPCAAAMIFCKRLKRVLSAVKLVRRVSRDLVPQGSVLEVEVSVQCEVPLGSSIVFWEILPVDTAPENEFPKIPFTFSGNQSITYRIIPRVHGLIRMPGTRLELSDRFFSTSADLTAPAYAGPDIQVQPVPYFEQRKTLADPGKQETNRVRVFKGMEIRMFRDYHEGDDIKSVDWKLSAKHGK